MRQKFYNFYWQRRVWMSDGEFWKSEKNCNVWLSAVVLRKKDQFWEILGDQINMLLEKVNFKTRVFKVFISSYRKVNILIQYRASVWVAVLYNPTFKFFCSLRYINLVRFTTANSDYVFRNPSYTFSSKTFVV